MPIKNENFKGPKLLNIFRVFGKSNEKPGDPQTTTIKMRMLRTAIEKIICVREPVFFSIIFASQNSAIYKGFPVYGVMLTYADSAHF